VHYAGIAIYYIKETSHETRQTAISLADNG